MRVWRAKLALFLKGVAMGAADVVPGVSGGTIAFISGIYPQLIRSLSSFDRAALKLLFNGEWRALSVRINAQFLLTVGLGVFASVLLLAELLNQLLQSNPQPVWGFFFGLIAASVIFLLRSQRVEKNSHWVFFLSGAVIAAALGWAPPLALNPTLPILFAAGAVALCAMILPGISGSFILLLLGLYPTLIAAVAERQLLLLAVFLTGGIFGLMLFSRILRYLMEHYEQAIILLMSGFLLGSLTIVWPWRHPPSDTTLRGNLWPSDFQILYTEAQVGLSLLAMLVGASLLLLLELVRLQQTEKKSPQELR